MSEYAPQQTLTEVSDSQQVSISEKGKTDEQIAEQIRRITAKLGERAVWHTSSNEKIRHSTEDDQVGPSAVYERKTPEGAEEIAAYVDHISRRVGEDNVVGIDVTGRNKGKGFVRDGGGGQARELDSDQVVHEAASILGDLRSKIVEKSQSH